MNHSRKRRVLIWVNVVLMCVLMAAFLVGVNLVAHTRFARIDMTTDKVWEISPQSRQILKSAKYDLQVYVNPVSEGPTAQDKALPEAWRRTILLLSEMVNQSPKIKLTTVNERSTTHAKDLSLFSRPEPHMIYFIYRTPDDKPVSRAISVMDLFNANPQTGEVLDYFGESRIISTIAQIISDRKLKIYATTEHKEIPPTLADRRGMSALTGRLMALENAEFKPLNLMRDKAVPEDADLVLIAWPASDFTTVETDALTKYWARGGRLFVAVHPLIPDPLSELRKFLETCGVRMNRDIVLDAQRELGDSGRLAVTRYGGHPVNQHMHGQAFRVDVSGSVDANIVNKRMQAMPLFYSSEACWTEHDLPPKPGVSKHSPGERWGPVPLAVAAEEATAAKPARIIAWGSVFPLMNEMNMIQDTPNEFTLGYLVNNFRWLTEREMLISAPTESRRPRMRPFSPPPGGDAVIGWVSLAGVPLLGVALGGLAWYFRRK